MTRHDFRDILLEFSFGLFSMAFEWDENNRLKILRERGIDIENVLGAFFDPDGIVTQDLRRDYGEARYVLLGMSSGRLYTIVFTRRNGNIRIIAAFKANAREQSRYDKDN